MTKKLFYESQYQKQFDAVILHQEEADGKVRLVLDQTDFYPEGGGQPCDLGTINDVAVEQVFEENGLIIHILPIWIDSSTVHGVIDWNRRLDFMQQHLGQHILSAVLRRDYQIHTIGFHMEREIVTIDLDRPIDSAQADQIESASNDIIYQNIPVETFYPSMDEIRQNSDHKIPMTNEPIRIVKIGDLDYSPCCGTHPETTAEVGMIKIQKIEKYKSGTRVYFRCGRGALRWLQRVWKTNVDLQRAFSCGEEELVSNLLKIKEESAVWKKREQELSVRLSKIEAREMIEKAPVLEGIAIVVHCMDDASQDEMRMLFSALTSCDGIVAILGNQTDAGAFLMIGCAKTEKRIDVREAFKSASILINGKGGGGPQFAQCFSPDSSQLSAALDLAFSVLSKNILKD